MKQVGKTFGDEKSRALPRTASPVMPSPFGVDMRRLGWLSCLRLLGICNFALTQYDQFATVHRRLMGDNRQFQGKASMAPLAPLAPLAPWFISAQGGAKMQISIRHCVASLLAASFLWLMCGCKPAEAPAPDGHAEQTEAQHAEGPQIASPDAAVMVFLDAVRLGKHDEAAIMLTRKAREEMQDAGMHVQPPGNPDAQFTIGNVRSLTEHGGAHVDSTWTDSQRTYEITWILRQESNSWRIAGMATRLFDDQAPLILNFENPLDMKAQVQAAEDEIARRIDPPHGEGIRHATLPSDGSQNGSFR